MAITSSDDILLPAGNEVRSRRSTLVAFVPIVVALAGVAAVLVGGVSARDVIAAEDAVAVDPVVTGSIEAGQPNVPVHVQRWE
jgi:hypothetical protein